MFPYRYHGNRKILLPWGVQLHHIFYSVHILDEMHIIMHAREFPLNGMHNARNRFINNRPSFEFS